MVVIWDYIRKLELFRPVIETATKPFNVTGIIFIKK